jgi:hypothetical protein
MSDVQIPVGFRRKARMDPPVVFAGFDVFIDDVFDKIRRRSMMCLIKFGGGANSPAVFEDLVLADFIMLLP